MKRKTKQTPVKRDAHQTKYFTRPQGGQLRKNFRELLNDKLEVVNLFKDHQQLPSIKLSLFLDRF